MNNRKSLILGLALVAVALCINWIDAQKTIRRPQQSSYQGAGSQPGSVSGGYLQSSSYQQSAPIGKRPPTQSYQSQGSAQRPSYQQQAVAPSSSYNEEQQSAEADSEPASVGSVNGEAGKDYPNYTRVPKTSFSCEGQPYEYGMYADEETSCQAYHLCYNGRKDSFLCGPGTVFNQRILHCDYWYSVDCGKSSQYYSSNAYMGSSQPEPGPAQAGGSVAQSSYRSQSRVAAPAPGYSKQSSQTSWSRQQSAPQPPPQQLPQQQEENY